MAHGVYRLLQNLPKRLYYIIPFYLVRAETFPMISRTSLEQFQFNRLDVKMYGTRYGCI